MNTRQTTLREFIFFSLKVILAHTLTYFLAGIIFSNIFDYRGMFEQPVIREFMRPYRSSWIFWGPFLQPVRGILFAAGLWPFRGFIHSRKNGWLFIWLIFVVFGIINTPAAASSSIEGIIYTKIPLIYHLTGLPEILLQTLGFSWIIVFWDKKRWDFIETGKKTEPVLPPLLNRFIQSVMTGCFGYIGYAVGGIGLALAAGFSVNVEKNASNIPLQLMFVFAFIINILVSFFLLSFKEKRKIPVWISAPVYFLVNVAVLEAYTALILPPVMNPLTACGLSALPAAIMVITIQLIKLKSKTAETENNAE